MRYLRAVLLGSLGRSVRSGCRHRQRPVGNAASMPTHRQTQGDSLDRNGKATPPFASTKGFPRKTPGKALRWVVPVRPFSVLARCWLRSENTVRREPTFSATRRHHPTGTGTAGTPRPTSSQITPCGHQINSQSTVQLQATARFSTLSNPFEQPAMMAFYRGKTMALSQSPSVLSQGIQPCITLSPSPTSLLLSHSFLTKENRKKEEPRTREKAASQGHASQPCVGYTQGLQIRATSVLADGLEPVPPVERTAVFR